MLDFSFRNLPDYITLSKNTGERLSQVPSQMEGVFIPCCHCNKLPHCCYNHASLFSSGSGGQRSKIHFKVKSRCWKGWFLLEALRKRKNPPHSPPYVLSFSAFSGCLCFLAVSPSSVTKARHSHLWFCHQITFLSDFSPVSPFKDPCGHIGPTR